MDTRARAAILSRMEKLDDAAVEAFIKQFYGYGSWAAPVWFVGMEEGGGSSIDEIRRRIGAWTARGRHTLEDLHEYHEAIGITRHIGEHAALQPTWAKLIHVLLGMTGDPATTDTVRRYQTDVLGRHGGTTCLIELLPLPSPGISAWLYGSATTLAYLANRDLYRAHVVADRIRAIREHLRVHRPRAVVCVGRTYDGYWQELAGAPLSEVRNEKYATVVRDGIMFLAVQHPVAPGVSNAYFRSIGARIAAYASSARHAP
ncbi:MAG TPA: hypothetical protein VNA69_09915 [Thermoanaerobaculia bacterium]|nr:hypothetical protein [Thermoanaerobaculia bacterium]